MREVSLKCLPISCTPMGSPFADQPKGTDIAGEPVRSDGIAALGALRPDTFWHSMSNSGVS